MHLYLIGYRGSGKSTIGKQLARVQDLPFVDTDELIEASSQQSIREIFISEGEQGFRERERAVIAEVAAGRTPTVVATGGGAVLSSRNRQVLESSGRSIWLQAPAEYLYRRIVDDATTHERRPNLSDRGGFEEVADVLAAREPLYRQVAQFAVATEDKSPDEIVAEILDWVKSQS